MANNRRGGPPDLRSTLGGLLRATLEQASAVRDVAYEQTRSGGGLLSQALTERRRSAAYTKLGEAIHQFAKRGELGELMLEPEIAILLGELDEFDLQHEPSGSHGAEAVSSADYVSSHGGTGDSNEEYRVWRPVVDESSPILGPPEDDDEPRESSVHQSRLSNTQSRVQGGGIRFGKDAADDDFDDDLDSYMHDDDVP